MTETFLYLVGVPAVVVAVVWALAYRGGPGAEKRYRPGRPYEFAPVWYLSNDRSGREVARLELDADRQHLALPMMAGSSGDEMQGAVGGASDRW